MRGVALSALVFLTPLLGACATEPTDLPMSSMSLDQGGADNGLVPEPPGRAC